MNDEPIQAGAGCGTIHFPDALFPTEGFVGIHDDPHFRVFLLRQGRSAFLLASAELVMLDDALLDVCRSQLEQLTKVPLADIWIHVTHAISTPHAPMEDPKRYALFQGAVLAAAEEAAAIQAVRTLQPARLLVGTAPCGINTNRDVETPSGWWIGTDPSGPSNHLLTLIRAEALDGSPICALVRYGIKPCTLDLAGMAQKTRLVSSDVAGFACAKVQEARSAPVLFLMSAAADQVPVKQAYREAVEPDGTVRSMDEGVEKGLSYVAELGQEMSNAIFRAAESASPLAVSSLDQEAGTLHWGTRGREKLHPRRELSYVQEGNISLPVQVLHIGDLALVGGSRRSARLRRRRFLSPPPIRTRFSSVWSTAGSSTCRTKTPMTASPGKPRAQDSCPELPRPSSAWRSRSFAACRRARRRLVLQA